MRLDGKSVVVMGGGALGLAADDEPLAIGNGRATAMLCAREGAAVTVADVRLAAAEETARAIVDEGGRAIAVECDVAVESQCERVMAAAVAAFGSIDGLVNVVGLADTISVEESTADSFGRVFDVNVRGHLNAIKQALPHLRRSGAGSIVNFSSLAGIRSVGAGVSYETTKAAIYGLTRNVAFAAGPANVRANTVTIGLSDSANLRSYVGGKATAEMAIGIPLRRPGSPWEVASAVVFLLSEDASYITGIDLPVDGGGSNLIPGSELVVDR